MCGLFVAIVVLLAACGALNSSAATAQATATPTSSTSRTQKSDSTVKVNETAAKVEITTAQNSATPAATAAPALVETPGHRGFPCYVSGRRNRIDSDLLRRASDAAQNLIFSTPCGRFLFHHVLRRSAAVSKHYRRLRGDSAIPPFAARTGLRARQRRRARLLRCAGAAALALAAVLLVRQSLFRGGQPAAPEAVPTVCPTDAPAPAHVTVQPLAATQDALAGTQQADSSAHTTPESAAPPSASKTAAVLPQYRALYCREPRPHRLAADRRH